MPTLYAHRLLPTSPVAAPHALCTLVVLVVLGVASPVAAQVVRPFTQRFATNVAGDISLIGNTLLTCPRPDANGCDGNNNNYDMVYVKDTPDPTVLNRSTATLALPTGATVVWAGLYWGGRSRDGNDIPPNRNQMQFRTPQTPAGTYERITSQIPLDTFENNNQIAYQGFAEVTALVQAGGSGPYVGADVKTATGENGYGGWALVVVFASPAFPTRNLIVFDGFANVSQGEGPEAETVETTITGFLTPLTGAFTTRVGMVVYEGDADLKGDQFRVNSINVGDAANPSKNFFNSTNAVLGTTVKTRTPDFANLLGFDVDSIDASGILPNGTKDATLTFTTDEEQYYPGVLTFTNDIFQPVAEVTKTVTDVNGGTVEPGDVLEYVLTVANTGNDPAINVVLDDPIPANTTYEPGSLATLSGVDVGVKTDGPGDDQAEFTGTAVRFRLGNGADATTGGEAPPGARGSFRFRVRVNAGVPANTVISNQAQVAFQSATTGQDFTALSDGDPSTDGAQPTTVITTRARASVSITKAASPNPVVAGQQLTYTLAVTNAGPSTATETVVTDAIPGGTTFVAATAPAGWTVITPAVGLSGTVTFTHPDVAVGTVTFTLVVLVVPTTRLPAISNTATVASPSDPASPASASVNTPIVPAQDLTILKDGPARAAQGQALPYRLSVNNPGPNPALNVTVTDPLPDGTTFETASAPAGWTVTPPTVGNRVVTYTIPSLAPGLTSLDLTVRVDETVEVGTKITNVVTVASPTDSNQNNNTASTVGTVVIEGTDLAVTKGVDTPSPVTGATVRYTVAVTNFGPSDATGVRLTDTLPLPAGLEFVIATTSPGTTYDNMTGVWTIGALKAGAGATLLLDALVLLQVGTITNTAAGLVGNQTDPDATNNQASAMITVRAADIAVAKSVDNAAPPVGATVTFTVTATNHGPDAATTLRVDDELPVGLLLVAAVPAAGTEYILPNGPWLIPALGVGQSTTLRLTAHVETSGTLTNQAAYVAGQPVDLNSDNDVATASLTAVPSIALVVTKVVNQPLVDLASTTVVFLVVVTNRGPSTATGVAVFDVLPLAFTPPPEAPGLPPPQFLPSHGTYDPATSVWSIGTLRPNEQVFMRIVARDFALGTQLNTARVQGNEAEVGTDNTAIVSVRVLENDVALTKTVDTPTPPLGGLVTYTIRVTNDGPDTAEVLDIYDVVTQGSREFVSATATRGIVTPEAPPPAFLPGATAPARLWTLATLPVGATETLTLVERVTSLGPLANTAATDAGLHVDPSLANNIASATVEVQPVADIAVTKRVSPATPQVGETVTFTVTATNRGPNDATGVQISDGLPAGLTLLAATPSQGTYDPATAVWAVGALATGTAATLDLAAQVDQAGELTNVATRTAADQFDPDPSNNAGGATLTSLPSADIQVRKTVTNPVPHVDDDVTFTLTVTNAGPTSASGVQVTDRLVEGLTLVRATPSQGTYSTDTGIWDIGALPDGDRVTLDLVATVTQAGELRDSTAKTAQGEDDPVGKNNVAGVTLNGQEADIQVVKTVDRRVPAVGALVTFTVTVTNNGPSAATGVQVTDRLPAGLTFVAATPSQGTYNAGTGVWDVGALASAGAGATAFLTLAARVETAGTLENTATRTQGAQSDPNPENDHDSVTIVGLVVADLTITKTDHVTGTAPGDLLLYTLVVTNTGPNAVIGARVVDSVPAALTEVTWTCTASPGSSCPASGTGGIDVTVDLLVGGTATFTILATVDPAATGTLLNQATVTGPSGTVDPDRSNNTATEPTDILPGPGSATADLTLAKSNGVSSTVPGATVQYTLVVRNNGPDAVQGATVIDAVPATLTEVLWTCRASPGSRCPEPASGTGRIAVRVDLLSGGAVLFRIRGTVAAPAGGTLRNVAAVLPPPGTRDPTLGNNVAIDTDPVTSGPAPPGPTVLHPPAGRKTVQTSALPDLAWRVVWLNNANALPLLVRLIEPIPAATTYVDGSVTCVAQGLSLVERCDFDAATNQVVADATLGADLGATTEEQAANEVVITFQTTVLPGTTAVTNQAFAHWDATDTDSVDDDISAGQLPVETGTAFGQDDPTVVTLPGLACLFQQRLLALTFTLPPPGGLGDSGGGGGGDGGTGADSPADEGSTRRVPVVQRAVDAEAPAVFTLSTPLEDEGIAGTAVTLAALQLSVVGTTVSQATEVTIANGLAPSALDMVENEGHKTARLAPQVDQVVITGSGVVVDLPATALTTAESLQLDRVDPAGAPGPLPGTAVSPLVAVTLTSGRTAFSSPVTLRLPYPDAEPDGLVDGTSPALAALALTVWRVDPARGTWEHLPEARVFPAFHEVRVATAQTGLYGVFQAADGSTGLAGTTAPASPAPLSAGAQGSGWQDIGVVTTFPFLVPFQTTALPNGTYAVRAICATDPAELRAVAGSTPTTSTVLRTRGDGGGGGCTLQPGGGWSRTTALDAVGHLGVPLVVLLSLGLWIWRRPR